MPNDGTLFFFEVKRQLLRPGPGCGALDATATQLLLFGGGGGRRRDLGLLRGLRQRSAESKNPPIFTANLFAGVTSCPTCRSLGQALTVVRRPSLGLSRNVSSNLRNSTFLAPNSNPAQVLRLSEGALPLVLWAVQTRPNFVIVISSSNGGGGGAGGFFAPSLGHTCHSSCRRTDGQTSRPFAWVDLWRRPPPTYSERRALGPVRFRSGGARCASASSIGRCEGATPRVLRNVRRDPWRPSERGRPRGRTPVWTCCAEATHVCLGGLLVTTQPHFGVGAGWGSHSTPTPLDPLPPPEVIGPHFAPGLRPIKKFFLPLKTQHHRGVGGVGAGRCVPTPLCGLRPGKLLRQSHGPRPEAKQKALSGVRDGGCRTAVHAALRGRAGVVVHCRLWGTDHLQPTSSALGKEAAQCSKTHDPSTQNTASICDGQGRQ